MLHSIRTIRVEQDIDKPEVIDIRPLDGERLLTSVGLENKRKVWGQVLHCHLS